MHQDLPKSTECGDLDAVNTLRIRYVAGSDFPIQVIRADGLPEVALTAFANRMTAILAQGTVRGYLREVLAFLNWAAMDSVAAAQKWCVFGEPREVRSLLHEYLTVVGECRILQRPDNLGLRAAYVNLTDQTRINVALLLAALKKMYEVLAEAGMYAFTNPLVHANAEQTINEFRRRQRAAIEAALGRPPMPPISGVDAPSADIRLSENYFRLVRREWVPKTIDDPDFPNAVYAAGQAHGWGIRELCAVRMLFESGARISEVFDLTAADWLAGGFTNYFLARSKGSHGRRVKTLLISSVTTKLLRKYFDHHRVSIAEKRLTIGDLTTLHRKTPERLWEIRLFTTVRGNPMTARLFRDLYWKPALRAVGIDADPHLCRHWFVTNALRHLEQGVTAEADLVRRKQELIQYMGWSSGERTLQAYEHVQRRSAFARRLHSIHETMHRRERAAVETAKRQKLDTGTVSSTGSRELAFLLGEDDDN